MPRKGENIYKRKDGRWEGRYIGCYDENHKAKYVYIYGKTYTEVKQKLAIERGRQKQHVPAEKKQITYAFITKRSKVLKFDFLNIHSSPLQRFIIFV